jgi:membrane associated rhomboid family serine protease
MGMIEPAGLPAKEPARRPRPVYVTGGITVVSFVGLLYVIEAIDHTMGQRLDLYGIYPRQADGLMGIIWAPLLHGGWGHLIANTIPLLILGFLMTLLGMTRFITATAIIWIVGGFGTWLIAPTGPVIGASGLIMGYLSFLIVFGFFTRTFWQIAVGVVVFLYYGTLLLGVFPFLVGPHVSWQGHLCGVVAGVLAAYTLSTPQRKRRELRRAKSAPPSLTS